jgi:alpha-1,3-rhamnosyltransferase
MSLPNSEVPLVSVLVPCFNHESYVISCLESIKAQDYPRIELLIIDDGSRDNSYTLISDWCSKNVARFARLKWSRTPNGGITKTLSSLLGDSCGEYVAFCASDDSLPPSSLTIRATQLTAHASVGAVFGRSQLMDNNGVVSSDDAARTLYGAKSAYYRNSCIKDELFFRWSMVGPASMYRKSALQLAGGIDTNYLAEDRSLYLRLMLCSDILYVDQIVASYRYHQQSVSRSSLTRAPIQADIAKLHMAMAGHYSGLKRLYMASYKVDLALLGRRNVSRIYPAFYLVWKAMRKACAILTMTTVSILRS